MLRSKLVLISVVFACSCTEKHESHRSRAVVRVNDTCQMTAGDLADQIAARVADVTDQTARSEAFTNQVKESVLNDFIVWCLVQRYAKEKGLFVRKEDLDKEIAKLRANYPDDLTFRQGLVNAGTTYESLLKKSERRLLEESVNKSVLGEIPNPSPAEVEAFYKKNDLRFLRPAEIRVSQIVVESEDQARLIEAEIKKGKDFAQLAKKYSNSPEGSNGGDLGWVTKDTHDIFEAASRIGLNQTTKILKTPFGHHILKLTGRRPAKAISRAEAEPEILREIRGQKEQEKYSRWLEAEILRARVYKDQDLIQAIKISGRPN
jgi:peptidyl-prolyl cis-trans isomerase C